MVILCARHIQLHYKYLQYSKSKTYTNLSKKDLSYIPYLSHYQDKRHND